MLRLRTVWLLKYRVRTGKRKSHIILATLTDAICLEESQQKGTFLDLIEGNYWKVQKERKELPTLYYLGTLLIFNEWRTIRFSCIIPFGMIVIHFNLVLAY
jgi:hypothetical protein